MDCVSQSKNVAPWDIRYLSPTKLATFYRLVGGNYDILFLNTPHPSLAFIYRSLGCFYSLQPSNDPFESPSTPALTPQGFVRWQTVQILLGPEEHVPFLQEAVKRFEIKSPSDGRLFPRSLPCAALPRRADPEMTQWHEAVSDRLRIAAEAENGRRSSTRADDVESLTDSSVDSQSVVDAADYFQPRSSARPYHSAANIKPVSPTARRPSNWYDGKSPSFRDQRRRSLPDQDPIWPRDGLTPTENSYRQAHSRSRPRAPSVLSVTSGSEITDDSSFTASEGSPSPEPVRRRHREPMYHNTENHGRRHSAHVPFDVRDYVPQPRSKHGHTLSPQFYASQNIIPGPQGHSASLPINGNGNRNNHRSSTPNGRSPQWRGARGSFDLPNGQTTPRERPAFRFADEERNYFEDSRKRQPMEPIGERR